MSCSLVGETQEILIHPESLAYRIYTAKSVTEKYNCSYSLNESYKTKFEQSDLRIAGVNAEGDVRLIEVPNHRFFMAMLFQPQLNMGALPHPLILSFLKEARGIS